MPIQSSNGQSYDDEVSHELNSPVTIDIKPFKSPRDDTDYDMEAATKAGVQPDARGHMPDTYKKPNHMTFSDESIYHSDKTPGGHWDEDEQGNQSFTPSMYNLQQHTPQQMQKYFKEVEPNVKLKLPTGDFDPDSSMTVVRHGSTKMNEQGDSPDLIRGWLNIPLDEKGREQAKGVAKELADGEHPIDTIYTSDLDRAHDTAKEVSKATGAPITVMPELRPWNVGELAGKKHDDVRDIMKDHIDNPDKPLPGGESFNQFKERALQGVEKAMQETPGQHLAVVTHHRVERLLNAWEKKGQPDDHSIDVNEMMKKGEEVGTAQTFHFSKKPIDEINERTPTWKADELEQTGRTPASEAETEMRKARATKFFQNLRNTWPVRGAEEGLRVFSGILQNFQDVYEGRVDPMDPESIKRMTDAAMMFGVPGSNVTKIPRGITGRELTKSAVQNEGARLSEDWNAAFARNRNDLEERFRETDRQLGRSTPSLSREDIENIEREYRNAGIPANAESMDEATRNISAYMRDRPMNLEQQPYTPREYPDPRIRDILNRPIAKQRGTKFSLSKNPQFTSGVHEEYYIRNEHGDSVGTVGVSKMGEGHYYLDYIGGGGPQALSHSGTRQIARQFFAEHPDARTLSASRISGARGARGGANVRYSIKDGKLILEKNKFDR